MDIIVGIYKKIADIINKYKYNIFFFTNNYSDMRKIVFKQNNNTC